MSKWRKVREDDRGKIEKEGMTMLLMTLPHQHNSFHLAHFISPWPCMSPFLKSPMYFFLLSLSENHSISPLPWKRPRLNFPLYSTPVLSCENSPLGVERDGGREGGKEGGRERGRGGGRTMTTTV